MFGLERIKFFKFYIFSWLRTINLMFKDFNQDTQINKQLMVFNQVSQILECSPITKDSLHKEFHHIMGDNNLKVCNIKVCNSLLLECNNQLIVTKLLGNHLLGVMQLAHLNPNSFQCNQDLYHRNRQGSSNQLWLISNNREEFPLLLQTLILLKDRIFLFFQL